MTKVSIILPCYNKADYIVQTINSVIHQTFTDWELIIIDDHSTDHSINLIESFSDPRITTIFLKENKGGNYCRNQGLEKSKGDYVIFFDADDLMATTCLEQRMEAVRTFPNNELWIFPSGVFQNEIEDQPKNLYWIPEDGTSVSYLSKFLKHQLPWVIMQPIWSVSFLRKLGGFDESFNRLQDVELHTRALLEGARVKAFPSAKPDVYYRIDEERITGTKNKFFERFAKAAIQFYQKFFDQVTVDQKSEVVGTLFEPLTIICHQYRNGNIDLEVFQNISNQLISACRIPKQQKKLKAYLKLETMSPIHPKGLKALFKKRLKL